MSTWVTRLIIANAALYFLSMAAPAMVSAFMLVPILVLSRPWTLVTYMFLHGSMWHLLFNMLGLYFFGPRLEEHLGGRRFLGLYFLSGIMGALLSFVLTPHAAVIGASGAVYGVFLGFAFYWPREVIYVWGVVPIESRWLVVIMTALSLLGGFSGGSDIAHFAHLGGFVGGYLSVRWFNRRSTLYRRDVTEPAPKRSDMQRWSRIRREDLHEVNREEFDRIQTKIKEEGLSSLTSAERAFLDRFTPQE